MCGISRKSADESTILLVSPRPARAVAGVDAFFVGYDTGFHVADVQNSANVAPIGTATIGYSARGIDVSGTIVCVADSYAGFRIIDIADPSNPETIGILDLQRVAFDAQLHGSLAFVVTRFTGLDIVDIADPTNPEVLSTIDVGSGAGAAARDSFVYLIDCSSTLYVIDITNPESPAIVHADSGCRLRIRISSQYCYRW